MSRGRWTDPEHKKFLQGLEDHGKGAWKIIAEEVIQTRTPEQVRIHAQKYFLRQDKAKRPSTSTKDGHWTDEEHELFLRCWAEHGKSWKKLSEIIKTRTNEQIRTHAQKYFQKLNELRYRGYEGPYQMDGKRHLTKTFMARARRGAPPRATWSHGGGKGGKRGRPRRKSSASDGDGASSLSSDEEGGMEEGGAGEDEEEIDISEMEDDDDDEEQVYLNAEGKAGGAAGAASGEGEGGAGEGEADGKDTANRTKRQAGTRRKGGRSKRAKKGEQEDSDVHDIEAAKSLMRIMGTSSPSGGEGGEEGEDEGSVEVSSTAAAGKSEGNMVSSIAAPLLKAKGTVHKKPTRNMRSKRSAAAAAAIAIANVAAAEAEPDFIDMPPVEKEGQEEEVGTAPVAVPVPTGGHSGEEGSTATGTTTEEAGEESSSISAMPVLTTTVEKSFGGVGGEKAMNQEKVHDFPSMMMMPIVGAPTSMMPLPVMMPSAQPGAYAHHHQGGGGGGGGGGVTASMMMPTAASSSQSASMMMPPAHAPTMMMPFPPSQQHQHSTNSGPAAAAAASSPTPTAHEHDSNNPMMMFNGMMNHHHHHFPMGSAAPGSEAPLVGI